MNSPLIFITLAAVLVAPSMSGPLVSSTGTIGTRSISADGGPVSEELDASETEPDARVPPPPPPPPPAKSTSSLLRSFPGGRVSLVLPMVSPSKSSESPAITSSTPEDIEDTPPKMEIVQTIFPTNPTPPEVVTEPILPATDTGVDNEKEKFLERSIIAESLRTDVEEPRAEPTEPSVSPKPGGKRAAGSTIRPTTNGTDKVPQHKPINMGSHNDENNEVDSTVISSEEEETHYPFYKVGPPWEDPKVVGEMSSDDPQIENIEMGYVTALKLCLAISKKYANSTIPERFYMWSPINQYVPLTHKAFPIRPPVFTRECLKFGHRACRGKVRAPLIKPCSYWAPMLVRRRECGFTPQQSEVLVNYRLPEHVPGNCPCTWPCIKRFDPIQRCRVPNPSPFQNYDPIDSNGEPKNEAELHVQINYALQLCRGLRLAVTQFHSSPIGWLPIRIDTVTTAHDEARPKRQTDFWQERIKRFKREASDVDGLGVNFSFDHDEDIEVKGDHDVSGEVFVKTGGGGGTEEGGVDGRSRGEVYQPVAPLRDRLVSGNCEVWKYKACPQSHFSEEDDEDSQLGGGVRWKRQLDLMELEAMKPRSGRSLLHMSFDDYFNDLQAEVRGKLDDGPEEDFPPGFNPGTAAVPAKCGQWYPIQFDACIPELQVSKYGEVISPHKDTRKKRDIYGTLDTDNMVDGEGDRNSTASESESGSSEEDEEEDDLTKAENDPHKLHRRGGESDGNPFPLSLTVDPTEDGSDEPEQEVKPNPATSQQSDKNSGEPSDFLLSLTIDPEEDIYVAGNTPEVKPGPSDHLPPAQHNVSLNVTPNFPLTMTFDPNKDFLVGGYDPGTIPPLKPPPSTSEPEVHVTRPDPGCRCDWPCMPFYDAFNRCYDPAGNVIVDSRGKPIVNSRSFRKSQSDPVTCINFVDIDEVYCRVKPKKRRKIGRGRRRD